MDQHVQGPCGISKVVIILLSCLYPVLLAVELYSSSSQNVESISTALEVELVLHLGLANITGRNGQLMLVQCPASSYSCARNADQGLCEQAPDWAAAS